ncbi:HDOD domain-containing protein [Undibacterium sp. LX40W]|uniref:HDOD domain-containing protein n=1 Tax=Undibacterium nitidum TaxID=2762298 RepID=A0A923HJL9_9BURK|nr:MULTISPECIES: HDOD domain-containing protein [Undibacterium]MBC3880272.1 HDOD domain-containing protein [Undibacterium nitidum]MBC3890992.1 HDOD domain-containing protein [Undibacterium sp. LX40W]
MIPIVSFLPVVNSQQKLVALRPDFGDQTEDTYSYLLNVLQQVDFLERLAPLFIMLPVKHPRELPLDFAERDTSKHIALCIPELSCIDKEVGDKLEHFASLGMRILMDDFNSKASLIWPETKGIIVDCAQGIPSHIQPWLFSLQNNQHLAKNLDTLAQQQTASEAGFSLFSGEFAFSPTNSNKTGDATARARLLKLLNLVSRDADVKELETLFKQDASLSFMLFKIVSSAAFAQTVKVSSFVQAINLLGRRQLQRWLQLLLYAKQGDHGSGLNPLMLRAAFRASSMEAYCRQRGGSRDEQDSAFMVGMFSLLDLLFSTPLWEILKPLNLPEEIVDALTERAGELGSLLAIVELADRPKSQLLANALQAQGIDAGTYYENQVYSYTWVNQVCQDM